MIIDPKKMDVILARQCRTTDSLHPGVAPTTICKIRRGEEISTKSAGTLAKLLNVDITELL